MSILCISCLGMQENLILTRHQRLPKENREFGTDQNGRTWERYHVNESKRYYFSTSKTKDSLYHFIATVDGDCCSNIHPILKIEQRLQDGSSSTEILGRDSFLIPYSDVSKVEVGMYFDRISTRSIFLNKKPLQAISESYQYIKYPCSTDTCYDILVDSYVSDNGMFKWDTISYIYDTPPKRPEFQDLTMKYCHHHLESQINIHRLMRRYRGKRMKVNFFYYTEDENGGFQGVKYLRSILIKIK